jgi:glycosyltransferase involved in cell wall biosynthesis
MQVRNEQWCLGLSARAAMLWCDQLIILDHASTDETPQIIRDLQSEYPGRVFAIRENDPLWNEADNRQRLLEESRRHGMTHLVFADADEVLSGNLIQSIRDTIASLQPWQALYLPWVCLWRDINKRCTSGVWGTARVPMAVADGPHIRWQSGDYNYQFHRRLFADATRCDIGIHDGGGLMHLQFADWRRAVAKQALYKMNEVIRWPEVKDIDTINRQYGQSIDETELTVADVSPEWWKPFEGYMQHLRLGQEPWQESECKRLWNLHGAEKFAGLDLFGVVN